MDLGLGSVPRLRRRTRLTPRNLSCERFPEPPALLLRGTTRSHPHPEPLRGPPFFGWPGPRSGGPSQQEDDSVAGESAASKAAAVATLQIGLLQQALVLVRHQVCLHLGDEVHHHHHHDQQ